MYIVSCKCGWERYYYGHGSDCYLYSCHNCRDKDSGYKYPNNVDRWNTETPKSNKKGDTGDIALGA